MIRTIGKENLKEDTIMYQQKFDYCNLIIGSEGVNFFKIGDNIIYDKSGINSLENNEYLEEFYFDQMYLNFTASKIGHNFQRNYFLKGAESSLVVSDSIFTDEKTSEEQYLIVSKKELEYLFSPNYYDSMFLMHRNGECEFAYDKKTGLEYNKKLNFAKKEDSNIIYGPNKFGKYSHFLITTYNNQFYVMWFKLEQLKNDQYKITTGPIEITEVDLEKVKKDAIKYINNFIPYEEIHKENESNKSRIKIKNIRL